MKLHEVMISPLSQPLGFDLSTLTNGTIITTGEGGTPIYQYTSTNMIVYTYNNEAFLFGSHLTPPPQSRCHTGFIIQRAYTKPEFTNKGRMTALYVALVKHGVMLVSDDQLSLITHRIWKTLSRRFNVMKYDTISKEITPILDKSELTDCIDDNGQIRLVAECHTPTAPSPLGDPLRYTGAPFCILFD